jgi:hypothetical protein
MKGGFESRQMSSAIQLYTFYPRLHDLQSPKVWHLYTRLLLMQHQQRHSKQSLKADSCQGQVPNPSKKTNNLSSRTIAKEMKVSIRTVSHIWSHWMKNKDAVVALARKILCILYNLLLN